MSALVSSRLDVPAGQIPDYRTFCRFVWQYRDESGGTVLQAPPWMYSIFIDDPGDVTIVNAIAAALCLNDDDAAEQISIIRNEDGARLSFANLRILHEALGAMARCGSESPEMRRLAEFFLWTLGFRWV